MTPKQFEAMMPSVNQVLVLPKMPHIFRLSYMNAGQLRLTLEYVGSLVPIEGSDNPGVKLFGREDVLNLAQFEAYRRAKWPLPHEAGRASKNATLAVQSGGISQHGRIGGKK